MEVKDILDRLEEIRAEFEYNQKEYSNPGTGLDPYTYGEWSGKSEAFEEAKFEVLGLINELKGIK